MSVHKEIYGNAGDQCQVTDWDQKMKSSGLTGLSTYNVGSSNVRRFECGSLSEIMSSFASPENTQMQEFPSSGDHPAEKNLKGKKRKNSSECGDQTVEVAKQNDVPTETAKCSMQKDEKKQNNGVVATAKGNDDARKEDFVHIRAKRGQATNSHSLAERVRREKISERMKLLQDLVPGCNKITGKAVMLDEIINYVQSLQKQVEFLSMKLATVNPKLDLDIKQLFLKENAHSRYGRSSSLGYIHPQLQPEMVIPSIQNSSDFLRIANNSQFSPMAQVSNSWDDEFQNAVQLGLIPNLPSEGMELNGCMKVEL